MKQLEETVALKDEKIGELQGKVGEELWNGELLSCYGIFMYFFPKTLGFPKVCWSGSSFVPRSLLFFVLQVRDQRRVRMCFFVLCLKLLSFFG